MPSQLTIFENNVAKKEKLLIMSHSFILLRIQSLKLINPCPHIDVSDASAADGFLKT